MPVAASIDIITAHLFEDRQFVPAGRVAWGFEAAVHTPFTVVHPAGRGMNGSQY